MTIRASGILFRAKDGTVLLLRRGAGSDHPGEWACPGGHYEEGDGNNIACAIRETLEETGQEMKPEDLQPWTRTVTMAESLNPRGPVVSEAAAGPSPAAEEVDFETFLCRVEAPFKVQLCSEHTGFAWVDPATPPEPLHPGARVALDRFNMDELGVAEAIRDGRLTSPQRFGEFWLVDLRITGTGMSFRVGLKEHVWRDPEVFLSERFVRRCNGLPVIMEHPEARSMLDTKEYADRNVGSVVLPYVKGDEVWGVAQIRDEPTVVMLMANKLSTSPGVSFRPEETTTIPLEDGEHLLIEGTPSLLDHVAICEQGVWDKGGAPKGISVNGVSQVDEKEREDARRKDEEEKKAREDAIRKDAMDAACAKMDEVADKMLKGIDSMEKRLDALEKKDADKERDDKARRDAEEKEREDAKRRDAARKDGETEEERKDREEREDKARKDAEAKEKADAEEKEREDARRKDAEEKEREDKARHDSVVALAKDVDLIKKAMPVSRTEDERKAILDAQSSADPAYAAWGDSAPRALDGETLSDYRRRLAAGVQSHSTAFKDSNLIAIADSATFDQVEKIIFKDAIAASKDITLVSAGKMREVIRTDATGRRIYEFVGMPSSWMDQFGSRARRIKQFVHQERRVAH